MSATGIPPVGSMPMPATFSHRALFFSGRPCHQKYDDFWRKHPPMDPGRRAKLFLPFSALKGFEECLREKEKPESPGRKGVSSMCSRYYVELSPELRPIIEAARNSSLAGRLVHDLARPVITQGEVRPADIAPVIAPDSRGAKAVFPMIWGFRQPDRENTKRSRPLINARSETADVKPTFRECWQRRRCIIPASYYFEWEHLIRPDGSKKAGARYAIQPAGASVTWLAGLYRMENEYPYFTILTREPSPQLSRIHDRMPLILPEELIHDWIDPHTTAAAVKEIAAAALTDMMIEKL